jgi:hypothetical protein
MNLYHGFLQRLDIVFQKSRFILFFLIVFLPVGFSNAATYEAKHIPWSGYWWPFTNGGLSTGKDYRGHPSPLEKYELFVNNRSTGASIDWYEDHYYERYAVNWAGLCPSWARAAVYESYEIVPSSVDNFIFRVGDKKGLLTLCHDGDYYIVGYGQNPEEFHLWLLQYIKDEKRAFTADLSTGDEVWFYPIYRYEMQTNSGTTSQSVNVKIYYADDGVDPDYIGTEEVMDQFTYTLQLNANGDVTGGEWTGASIKHHPEVMKIPVRSQAMCPYLDCDEIRRIAQTRDDFLELEDNAAQTIDPGTYHLILLDSDEYILNGSPGDEFYVELLKQDGSLKDINITIKDTSDGRLVEQGVLDSVNSSLTYRLVQQDAPFTMTLSQADNYEDPNIYTLVLDRIPAYVKHIPYVPSSNSGDRILEDVILVAYNKNGQPQQTLFGPEDIQINERKMILFDDLPFRTLEYRDLQSLKLMSDDNISMVNLFASPNSGMGGFGCEDAKGSHLVIADTFYTWMGTGAYMKGALINETFDDAPVEIRLFSDDGIQAGIIDDTIAPGRNITITPGAVPFGGIVDGGWMDIVSENGTKLSGYQYTRDVTGKKNAVDTLFALPVFKTVKYVPHIPPPLPASNWLTQLTVINPFDRINRIDLHLSRAGDDHGEDQSIELAPYEKQIIDLTAEFGMLPGESLFHSMLEIRGRFPFVGYYTYLSPSSAMRDKAGFPLMDDLSFKKELILPHVPAKNGKWWTGVGICNPNAYSVDVMAEPYGADGELIENLTQSISLEPGAYEVFNVRSLFDATGQDISFIRFFVEEDMDGVIGGFYLYGNSASGTGGIAAISGANM